MLFTVKDKWFKQEGFLEEVKQDFTAFINTFVLDEKKKLAVFDKHSPYLATKKIGKNNPKEEHDTSSCSHQFHNPYKYSYVFNMDIAEDIMDLNGRIWKR